MSESAPKQLTQEQLDRIAFNKAQALERLKAKRKATEEAAAANNIEKAPPKKAKWIKTFYEYDLSTMEDSKGGFIIDESSNDKELKEKEKQKYVIEPYYRK